MTFIKKNHDKYHNFHQEIIKPVMIYPIFKNDPIKK